jgi:pyrroline-5-carboxylate reductase
MRFGIIGLGTMGRAIEAALKKSGETAVAGTRHGDDNGALVRDSDVLVLCVKPYQARTVVEGVAADLAGKLLISICAGIATADLRAWSGDRAAVVRAMPNTPGLIGDGMTVLAPSASTTAQQLAVAVHLFATLGRTTVLDEDLMDGVTGLSGCGPAYVFLIIEALADAGEKVGIDHPTSTLLAAQTLLGAARLVLERGESPATLRREVATPGGCTIEGLAALEQGGLRKTLTDAVVAATNRSRELRNA